MQIRNNRVGFAQNIVVGIGVAALVWLLWEKLQFGFIRYFDADEMAYLHWAHSVFMGNVPYIDFLSYVPPGFYYALAPLYWIARGTDILLYGRVYAFVVFAGIVWAGVYSFWRMRRSWIAVLSGVFIAFIPIPADKFIEIRPDNLATLIAMMGAIVHIIALERGHERRYWLVAGMLYTSALLILPKALPHVAAAIFVTGCWWIWDGRSALRKNTAMVGVFIAGLSVPLLLFILWSMNIARSAQELGTIWYSLTRLPLEVNKIGALFPMEPYQFFYPNALLYGGAGWNMNLLTNHGIWLVGLLMGAARLVTPVLANGKKGMWAELLIGCSFFGYIVLFIFGYPMRHEQYLIPIGIFAAWYAADGLYVVWESFRYKAFLQNIRLVGLSVLMIGIWSQAMHMHELKRVYTNAGDYEILREAIRLIPPNAYVFDLVGSTIYFRDPYYVSAVPFGQWAPYVSRAFPSVKESLIRTNTSYVYEGQLKRAQSLSPIDMEYIASEFHRVPSVPGLLSR